MSASHESKAFNPAKAEAFAGRFMTVLNDAALCLMASVGHRTGLFDAMREMPPSTSAEIATRAGLNERYVREWLGAMTTGGIVEVAADTSRFSLPAEHSAVLTRAAAADNMAVFAQDRAWTEASSATREVAMLSYEYLGKTRKANNVFWHSASIIPA